MFGGLIMKKLPNEQNMNELLELAKDAYEKARKMHNTATEISQKWETRYRVIQSTKQPIAKTE